jgi:hypothetical protein
MWEIARANEQFAGEPPATYQHAAPDLMALPVTSSDQ